MYALVLRGDGRAAALFICFNGQKAWPESRLRMNSMGQINTGSFWSGFGRVCFEYTYSYRLSRIIIQSRLFSSPLCI